LGGRIEAPKAPSIEAPRVEGRGIEGSGVASMEQMEQLLPGPPRTTFVIRAHPKRYSGAESGSLLSDTSSYLDEPTVRRCDIATFIKGHYLQTQVYRVTVV